MNMAFTWIHDAEVTLAIDDLSGQDDALSGRRGECGWRLVARTKSDGIPSDFNHSPLLALD